MSLSRRRLFRGRLRRQCLRTAFLVASLSLFTEGNIGRVPQNLMLSCFGVSTRIGDDNIFERRSNSRNNSINSEKRPHLFWNPERGSPLLASDESSPLEVDQPLPPPAPPKELPLRFLRAGKGDPAIGLNRYEATLAWRKEAKIDTILRESFPDFAFIKQHYPHFYHLKGRNGEPCFYERPAQTNLRALREGGVTLEKLLRHYTMITEFQWQYLERRDLAHSIYVIDLAGIRMKDFFGESVDFVKKAAALSALHYPERAGFVFVINVPSWFKVIWTAVRPIVDDATLKKIYILRGADEIRKNLLQRISLENIPPEYGGTSIPLGHSSEEKLLTDLMAHNNALASQRKAVCEGCTTGINLKDWACSFCRWTPVRSY